MLPKTCPRAVTGAPASAGGLRFIVEVLGGFWLFVQAGPPGPGGCRDPCPMRSRVGVPQTHLINFFVRYFAEMHLPMAAVEQALDQLPADWLVALARTAHARRLRLLLEFDPDLGGGPGRPPGELFIQAPQRRRASDNRPLSLALG